MDYSNDSSCSIAASNAGSKLVVACQILVLPSGLKFPQLDWGFVGSQRSNFGLTPPFVTHMDSG